MPFLLAAPRINEGDDVLVVFNDTLFVTDLTRIPVLCQGLDGLIYSKEVEDPKRFGVNVMKDNVIVDMVEKPDTPVSNWLRSVCITLKMAGAL